MKQIKLLLIFTITATLFPFNKDNKQYDISRIPLQLILNSSAVVRFDQKIFEVESYNSANLKVKYAVTIFNKSGQSYGNLLLWYDKFRKIENLDATIFDGNGNEIRDMEKDDVKDYSDFANYSLYDDNRLKFVQMFYDKFPYTIEFNYELEYDGYLTWPSWNSRATLDPVQYTSFEVALPENYKFRYWCNSDSINPSISKKDGSTRYLWEQKSLPKLSYEAVGEDLEDISLVVKIAPTDFEIDGYRGKMDSWKSFGNWYHNLTEGRDLLPEAAIKEITQVIGSVTDEKRKVEILYHYLQTKTRYVSVQLGIGGWQPYDANYVFTNGYGDCKALSNYMVAMLKFVGINAYPVLINSGNDPERFINDFPSNQFNHVIVCIPFKSDTMWLECTSNILSPGFIGSSNENRYALMLTPDGGVLVKTPFSKSGDNIQTKKISVTLSNSGKAIVNANIKFFGDQYDDMIYLAKQASPIDKQKWIKESFEVPDITLSKYTFGFDENSIPSVGLTMELSITKYGNVIGNRIFVNPNLMERRKSVPKDVEKRLSPVKFDYPYTDIDSVYYTIPELYTIENLPNATELTSSFGSFISKTIANSDNSLVFVRMLKINDYSIPAENYNEYKDFFSKVVNSDKQNVVLIRK